VRIHPGYIGLHRYVPPHTDGRMTTMRFKTLGLLALAALTLTGCNEKSVAYGDANSIIAIMSPDMWAQVSEDVYGALEQTIQTVRDEKTFTVTYQDPGSEEWSNLRKFRQMLLVGTDADPWIAEALAVSRDPVTEPGMSQSYDVWSRGQNVTVILLSEPGALDELRGFLPEIREMLDRQFREYATSRMFMTGADTALADTLMAEARFSVMVPVVYKWARNDSVYVFRNDQPDPSELIRQVAVTWMSPIPTDMQPEGILDWRAQVVEGIIPRTRLSIWRTPRPGPSASGAWTRTRSRPPGPTRLSCPGRRAARSSRGPWSARTRTACTSSMRGSSLRPRRSTST